MRRDRRGISIYIGIEVDIEGHVVEVEMEFAFLREDDEWLIRMFYDDRLVRSGNKDAEVITRCEGHRMMRWTQNYALLDLLSIVVGILFAAGRFGGFVRMMYF